MLMCAEILDQVQPPARAVQRRKTDRISVALRDRVLEYLRRRLKDDPPPLRLVFEDGAQFDLASQPTITLAFHTKEPVRALLRGDFARAADAYVRGELTVEGRIEDILKTGISLAERIGKSLPAVGLARIAALWPKVRSKRSDAANISHHYDVGNDFYRLWLDRRMIYSCAYFRSGNEDIDQAQQQKLDHLCRKLMLKPGERLLDIGCGWGGLVSWAAEKYGVEAVGVTLSARQYSYAREALKASARARNVEVRLQHYRDIDDASGFEKIVSVGMYEHVGLQNLPTYFQMVARQLKPGGAFLNHGIVATDPHGRTQSPPGGEFIDRHVFPGGAVPHLSRVLLELSRAGLEFADAEDLRPHYALTLQHWSERLESCREQAIKIAGPEIFRIWRVFLAGMACAFDRRWLSVAQVLAFKPLPSGEVRRPWTRSYQYEDPDAPGHHQAVPFASKLDWT
jgi:cyclopropane-fatty-acyl-phospholipid synthase